MITGPFCSQAVGWNKVGSMGAGTVREPVSKSLCRCTFLQWLQLNLKKGMLLNSWIWSPALVLFWSHIKVRIPLSSPPIFTKKPPCFSGYSRETHCGQAQTLQTRTPAQVTAHVVEQLKRVLPPPPSRKRNTAEGWASGCAVGFSAG